MTTYKMTTNHAASSYGEPVLIDDAGIAIGPREVGLWGTLPSNFCGCVNRYDAEVPAMIGGVREISGERVEVNWSGYGDSPNRMWEAVKSAFRAGADRLRIYDAGLAEAWPANPHCRA